MPRSTREWALRKLKEAIDNLSWSGYHINEVAEKYQDAHPEIAEPLGDILTALSMLMETITKIRGSF